MMRVNAPGTDNAASSNDIDFPHKDYHDGPGKYDDDDENPSRAVEDAIPANPS